MDKQVNQAVKSLYEDRRDLKNAINAVLWTFLDNRASEQECLITIQAELRRFAKLHPSLNQLTITFD